jgi:hypothetical protein
VHGGDDQGKLLGVVRLNDVEIVLMFDMRRRWCLRFGVGVRAATRESKS